jgi:ribosomal protein S18 acetylase RimI-like enzyme
MESISNECSHDSDSAYLIRSDWIFVENPVIFSATSSVVVAGKDVCTQYVLIGRPSNNTNGVGFLGYADGEMISGKLKRIVVTGVPGEGRACIDQFYVDKNCRHMGHGPHLMRLLVDIYTRGGTKVLTVPAPTREGTYFYKKFGYHRIDGGDLQLHLVDEQ